MKDKTNSAETIMLYNLYDCCQISTNEFSEELTRIAIDIDLKKCNSLIEHLKTINGNKHAENDLQLQLFFDELKKLTDEKRRHNHRLCTIYNLFRRYEEKVMAMTEASTELINELTGMLEFVKAELSHYQINKNTRLIARIERNLRLPTENRLDRDTGNFVFRLLLPILLIEPEGRIGKILSERYKTWRQFLLKYNNQYVLMINSDSEQGNRTAYFKILTSAFTQLRNTWTGTTDTLELRRRTCGAALQTIYDTVLKMEKNKELVDIPASTVAEPRITRRRVDTDWDYDDDEIISSGVLMFLRWLPILKAEENVGKEVMGAMDQVISNIQKPYSEYLAKTNKAADDRVFLNDDATALRSELIRALCRQSVFSEQFHSFYSGEG